VFGHGRANAELKCDIADVSPGWVRVPPENETCRTRILATMEMLEFRHRREVFRLDEIIDHMVELGSPYTVATIRATILSSMCVEARAGNRTVYADLERVRRGHYRLRRSALAR